MTTEEKLNALKVVSNAKDKVDAHLVELETYEPDKILSIEINHNRKSILLTPEVSKHLHAMLSAMLEMQRKGLVEKAKQLMK